MTAGNAAAPGIVDRRADELLVTSRAGRALLWGIALALALLCASISAGGAAVWLAPEAGMRLKPVNGFTFANAATNLFDARQSVRGTSAAATARERALARRALVTEPLAVRAWSMLATADEATGHGSRARAEMQAALRLSRRDELTNMWMVTDAGRRDDLSGMMRAIDRTIITAPAASALYMPILAAVLANDATVPEFVAVMRRRPPWALNFWREATVSQPALRNAGELRARLALTAPEEREVTATLLSALASAGHYETAERLYRSAGSRGAANGAIVTNGDFRHVPSFPVFDWDLISSGEFNASIDPAAGVMDLNALPGNSGTVARQLVALDRGAYRLEVTLAKPFASSDTAATVRLKCAREGIELAVMDVRGDRSMVDFDQVHDCRFAWLSIDAIGLERGGANDLAIRRIALTRR